MLDEWILWFALFVSVDLPAVCDQPILMGLHKPKGVCRLAPRSGVTARAGARAALDLLFPEVEDVALEQQ